MAAPATRLWAEAQAQLAASRGLRIGTLAIVVILWIYALLVSADELDVQHKHVQALRERLAQVAPLSRERQWVGRVDEVQQQLTALRSLVWTESDLGLAEASFQDWLRATAGKAGLSLRELAIARQSGATPAAAASPEPASSAVRVPKVVKARLVADFNRVALMGFLAEASRSERAIVIDRLIIRPAGQPPSVEIELRILAAMAGRSGS